MLEPVDRMTADVTGGNIPAGLASVLQIKCGWLVEEIRIPSLDP